MVVKDFFRGAKLWELLASIPVFASVVAQLGDLLCIMKTTTAIVMSMAEVGP